MSADPHEMHFEVGCLDLVVCEIMLIARNNACVEPSNIVEVSFSW